MYMTRWNREQAENSPFALNRIRTDMDRLLDRLQSAWGIDSPDPTAGWAPATDVKDLGNELVVCTEVPGVRPEQIDVTVVGDSLRISGERREEREDERGGFYARERRYGSFSRTIPLPPGSDAGNIRAECRDGELIVHIPKTAVSQPRRIPIHATGVERAQPGGQSQESPRGNGSASPSRTPKANTPTSR
jgi:HSP20 family protein